MLSESFVSPVRKQLSIPFKFMQCGSLQGARVYKVPVEVDEKPMTTRCTKLAAVLFKSRLCDVPRIQRLLTATEKPFSLEPATKRTAYEK
jgi:hypothetical protein